MTPAVSQTITVFTSTTDDVMMQNFYYDCDHENGGAGSYLVNTFFKPGTPSYDFTFTCSYPTDGFYCVAVCVSDEGTGNCAALMNSGSACAGKKRNANLLGVSITAGNPLAGDPYFLGKFLEYISYHRNNSYTNFYLYIQLQLIYRL